VLCILSNDNEEKLAERVKGWILGLINGIDAQMWVGMIKNNEIPTLWEFELPKGFDFVKKLAVQYKEQIMENLTLETVMNYAKEYRPDLARILVHKVAQQWMNRFLRKCAFMFEHIELEPYEIQALYEERMMELLQKREAQEAEQITLLLAQKQKELEIQEEIKAKELEKKRHAEEQRRAKIQHDKELKAQAKQQRRSEYEKAREMAREIQIPPKQPLIEIIPPEKVENQLEEQAIKPSIELNDSVDKKLFDVLGKHPSENKYDFL